MEAVIINIENINGAVNGLHLCGIFQVFWQLKALYNTSQHSSFYTHLYTNGRGFYTKCQPVHQEHTHTHLH